MSWQKLFSKTERSKQKSHKVEGIGSNMSSVPKNGTFELDKNTQSKEALSDKILDSSPSLATSRDSVGSSTGPIIPQTQSQQESPIPQKEEPPTPQRQSKSPVPPAAPELHPFNPHPHCHIKRLIRQIELHRHQPVPSYQEQKTLKFTMKNKKQGIRQ